MGYGSVLKRDPNRIGEELWNCTHTNSNRLAAVSIKTTGPDPKFHEIVQICVFPLNSKFELAKETIPFYIDIKPTKPQLNLNLIKGAVSKDKYLEIKEKADMPQVAAKLFDSWMEDKIKLAYNKKLLPLTFNWAAMRPFIKNWLGPINFDSYFSHEYRDIQSLALFCNDYADMHTYQLPYPKMKMGFISKILNIEYNKYQETIYHCKIYSEVYRSMMRKILPSFSEPVKVPESLYLEP